MNAGVGTSPCGVQRTPTRAAPSVAVTSNWLTPASLEDQHRVAERVEPIPLLDRDLVEPSRLLDSREGHHEREQRRPRQMEVRQQPVDAPELEARRDEEVGAALERAS